MFRPRVLPLIIMVTAVGSFAVLARQTIQRAISPTVSPSIMLQNSLGALVGNAPVSDVTLTGTVRRIAGSDDDTGTASLIAVPNGSARMDFSFSSSGYSEISNLASDPKGVWSGPDRTAHKIAYHNLLTEQAWFFPAFSIARRLASSTYTATFVGQETLDGHVVEHLSISQAAPLPNTPGDVTYEHLSQVEFYLDRSTLLPAAIAFNIHPDNNALLYIPIEIKFSDYKSASGVQFPSHVQKYINNTLYLDIEVQSVSVNTGVSTSTFGIQ